uniref:Methylosome subunit pICln n=1 Tax=Erpetoichthys calabaricus TaxID=27687 RepID=A0A8C4RCJ5_ERPCA
MVLLKNVSPPSEGIHYQQAETMDVLDGKGLCLGTLYVEHLYVMVNCKLNDLQSTMSEKTNDDEGEEEEDDSDPISKIRFVPSDKTALELLFSAMCECQYDVEKAQQGHGEEDLHLNSVWRTFNVVTPYNVITNMPASGSLVFWPTNQPVHNQFKELRT